MITEKLYENNPYLKEFSARVLSCEAGKGGWLVVLDRTAFYPEGGGQPCDFGTLGEVWTPARDGEELCEAWVSDVHERDGVVYHTVDRPLSGAVQGVIEWDRRFDHMQQHSGEHLVSGILHRLYGCENVGFHMGKDVVTIDFDRVLRKDQLERAEFLANEAVWANRDRLVRYYDSEAECPEDYRSKKPIPGRLRLVEFPDADLCACCGTHVARTGEIGIVKLLSVVKFHQGVRVEMVCGRRALAWLSRISEQNRQISGLLSAKPLETAAAVDRTLGELAQVKHEKARWETRCFDSMAEALRGAGDVVLFEEDLSPDSLRRLCAAVLETCGGRCAVFSGTDGAGWAYAVGQEGADLRSFVREMNAALGGRGGGKPNFAQGRVGASRGEIEAFLAES